MFSEIARAASRQHPKAPAPRVASAGGRRPDAAHTLLSWRFVSLVTVVCSAIVACRGSGDAGSASAPSASSAASSSPVGLDDLPASVTDSRCARDDSAKLEPSLEAALAALRGPIPPKQQRRFGWTCLSKPSVLVALEYGDEATAKRALLHHAHLFVLPADPTLANARPRGAVVRSGTAVAFAVGEAFEPIAIAVRERGFVTAVPGFPPEGRGGAGSALPFVSRPGAFDHARQARDYDYGCPEKVPATVHACADLERYERGGEAPRPGSSPQAFVGTCVIRPYPTPTSPGVVEEACWLLWSPLGVDAGTVKSLSVSLGDVSMEKLRAQGGAALAADKAQALRDAIVEHGPGAPTEWVDGAHRALVADGKEALSVRADEGHLVVVRATNDRKKDALLVAGFARSGALPPR